MYLSTGEVITVRPSEQSIQFLPRRTAAVWQAVERACEAGDFRPRPGPLCDYCAFKPWCPAFGGDPDRAKLEAPVAYAQRSGAAPARPRVTAGRRPSAEAAIAVSGSATPSPSSTTGSTRPSTASGATPSPTASSTPPRRWATGA